jgi:hypothetical protein
LVAVAPLGVPLQGQPGGTPGVTAVPGGATATLTLAAYPTVFVAGAAVLIERPDIT